MREPERGVRTDAIALCPVLERPTVIKGHPRTYQVVGEADKVLHNKKNKANLNHFKPSRVRRGSLSRGLFS